MRLVWCLLLLPSYAEALSIQRARESSGEAPAAPAKTSQRASFTIPNLVKKVGPGVPDPAIFASCVSGVQKILETHNDRLTDKMETCHSDFTDFHLEPEVPVELKMYKPAEILSSLNNRWIVFLGDSTTYHTWVYFGCFLQQASGNAGVTRSSFTWADGSLRTAWRQSLNITLEFVGGGRNYEGGSFYGANGPSPLNLAAVFPKVLDTLGPRDVVLVNSGVHDNTQAEMVDDRPKHGKEELEPLLPVGLDWWEDRHLGRTTTRDTTQVAHAVAREVKVRRAKGPSPMVIWRESTPQHYQKQSGNPNDGLYPHEPRIDKLWKYACKALSVDMLSETASSNIRNNLVKPILEEADIPILKVWQALATHPDSHCGRKYDCTHWAWDVNRVIVQGFVNLLIREWTSDGIRALLDKKGFGTDKQS